MADRIALKHKDTGDIYVPASDRQAAVLAKHGWEPTGDADPAPTLPPPPLVAPTAPVHQEP